MLFVITRIVIAALALLLFLYVLGVFFLYKKQERYIFYGDKLPDDHNYTFDLPYQEYMIDVEDGEVHAVHIQQERPRGLFFFLHGNCGNVQHWVPNTAYYQAVNYDLFIMDYRGFGKSRGIIKSEEQLHADVMAAWNVVAPKYLEKSLPIVIYGRSLGSGLAVELASKVSHELLILASPFYSLEEVAKEQVPWVPSRVMRYALRSHEKIATLSSPVLIVHGDKDQLIPLSHAERLQALDKENIELSVIEGAAHADLQQFDSYNQKLIKAINDLH